jgi:hypothetical protein
VLSDELSELSEERRILAVLVRCTVLLRRSVVRVSRAESCSGVQESEGSLDAGVSEVTGREWVWEVYLDGVVDYLLACGVLVDG